MADHLMGFFTSSPLCCCHQPPQNGTSSKCRKPSPPREKKNSPVQSNFQTGEFRLIPGTCLWLLPTAHAFSNPSLTKVRFIDWEFCVKNGFRFGAAASLVGGNSITSFIDFLAVYLVLHGSLEKYTFGRKWLLGGCGLW